jgi:hypothetical protein
MQPWVDLCVELEAEVGGETIHQFIQHGLGCGPRPHTKYEGHACDRILRSFESIALIVQGHCLYSLVNRFGLLFAHMHEIVSLPLVALKADPLIIDSFHASASLYTEALQGLHELRGSSIKHYDHQYAHHALAQMRAAIAGLPYLEFSVAYLPSDVESPWVEEANRFSKEGITRHSDGGGGRNGANTDTKLQALTRLLVVQDAEVRAAVEKIRASDQRQICSHCHLPRLGHVCLVDPARVAEETKRVSTRLERCKLILELESLPAADTQDPTRQRP